MVLVGVIGGTVVIGVVSVGGGDRRNVGGVGVSVCSYWKDATAEMHWLLFAF